MLYIQNKEPPSYLFVFVILYTLSISEMIRVFYIHGYYVVVTYLTQKLTAFLHASQVNIRLFLIFEIIREIS